MSTLETVQIVVAWVLMLGGSFFALVGAFGTWRLPDFWSRLHAASVTDSAGMILMVTGMCVYSGLTLVTVKLIAIGIFLFITGPTATHAVANAALVSGLRPDEAEGLVADELAPVGEDPEDPQAPDADPEGGRA